MYLHVTVCLLLIFFHESVNLQRGHSSGLRVNLNF